jgi:hypothetical protein
MSREALWRNSQGLSVFLANLTWPLVRPIFKERTMNPYDLKKSGLIIVAATMVATGAVMTYSTIIRGRNERIKIGKEAEANLKAVAYASEVMAEEINAGHYKGRTLSEIIEDMSFIVKMNDPRYK